MKKITVITAVMLAAFSCYAGVNDSASIIFPILDMGAGARALGMGEAYTAVADDAGAVYWNAAGLGSIKTGRIALTYDKWFVDTFFDQVLLAFPLPKGGIGVNLVYLNMGSVQGRTMSGAPTQSISPYSFGGSVAYGIDLGTVSLGAAIKLIGQSTGRLSNLGFGGDLGILYRTGILSAGLNFQNLGVSGDYSLPINIKAGVAVRAISAAPHGLILALDNQYLFKDEDYLSAGLEYAYDNTLFVRLGYKIGFGHSDLDGVKGVCGGVGFKLTNFAFDYAIVPYGDLGITHRVMLTYVFSDKSKADVARTFEDMNAGANLQEKEYIKAEEKKPVKNAGDKKAAKKTAAKKLSPLEAAALLEKQGKNALAADKYKAIILDNPKSAEAWKRLALLYQKENNKKEAIGCFETYLTLNPADKKTAEELLKYKQQ